MNSLVTDAPNHLVTDAPNRLVKYQQQYIDIKNIDTSLLNDTVLVNGWVRNKRIQANLAFVEVFGFIPVTAPAPAMAAAPRAEALIANPLR